MAKLLHFGPVHFRAEMVLGVVAVVEEKPVVDFSVAAYAPGNRFVRVRAVMPIVTVQITEAVTEIPKRQEKQYEPPVDEVNRVRRNNDRHYQERRCERPQFDISPEIIAVLTLAQFAFDCANIIAKET